MCVRERENLISRQSRRVSAPVMSVSLEGLRELRHFQSENTLASTETALDSQLRVRNEPFTQFPCLMTFELTLLCKVGLVLEKK